MIDLIINMFWCLQNITLVHFERSGAKSYWGATYKEDGRGRGLYIDRYLVS